MADVKLGSRCAIRVLKVRPKSDAEAEESVLERIGVCEVLAQLAEEAAELSHAALKLRRVLDGRNPTPVSLAAAEKNLIEEIADVSLCAEQLGVMRSQYAPVMGEKLRRWNERLNKKELGRTEHD